MNDVLIAIREYLSGADDAGLRRVIDAPASQWVNVFHDSGGPRCLVGHVLDITAGTWLAAADRMVNDRARRDVGVSMVLSDFVGPEGAKFPPALVSSIHAIAGEILTTRALAGVTDERATVEV